MFTVKCVDTCCKVSYAVSTVQYISGQKYIQLSSVQKYTQLSVPYKRYIQCAVCLTRRLKCKSVWVAGWTIKVRHLMGMSLPASEQQACLIRLAVTLQFLLLIVTLQCAIPPAFRNTSMC